MSLLAGAWTLDARPVAAPDVADAPSVTPEQMGAIPYGAALVDLRTTSRAASVALLRSFPVDAVAEPVSPAASAALPVEENVQLKTAAGVERGESAPLPPRRPPEFGLAASVGPDQAPNRHLAQQNRRTAPPAPSDNRTFLEKFLGAAQPSGPQASGPALAYAAPETGLLGGARSVASTSTSNPTSAGYDRWTAIYDISAHVVHMPNGQKLEAHSGLRERLDDPRYVHERMRGATPPHLYELTPREALFHGVRALRLNPVGPGNIYGRAGLLAHTYMLGPNGDSNGCVSFRDYNAFLRAYQNGEVKRLAVVARLD